MRGRDLNKWSRDFGMERPRGFVRISSRRLKVASPLYMMFGPLTEPPFVTFLLNKDLLGV